ncbi:putative cysteine ligase BshC [Kroppenstedtia guangzhouensis]|jgi:bacillithiol synthase|uniref:Putative cysteine ligase BshC n=1 Tax=Kroppenstedtia guangzhouensis TaxID=1274356 RepID=A0ABQ1FXH5_9BACL|nr:bacillithiol biosynthesis cysteine-adding enzyme BshC [Kroppenstedtia guangzhouensis]GGA32528.1 putative cysteine ligase BshC [Kroppenstedtia guangzhouensis]
MRVEDVYLEPDHPLVMDYLHLFHHLEPFYDYNPGEDSAFVMRAERLNRRETPVSREDLASVLEQYHAGLEHPAVQANLDRLRRPDSLVVVGGQQAGILTGPLYTLYKGITLIQLARREEKRLNRPVIPVFWIAGEDHDLEEVNHLHLLSGGNTEKIILPVETGEKMPVSEVVPGRKQLEGWIRELGRRLPDTPHKSGLLDMLQEITRNEVSLSRHFARLMHRLFGRYGLLMIDSAFPALRRLEVPFFQWLIQHNETFGQAVLDQAARLQAEGYPVSVDLESDKAHLFLLVDGQRQALYRSPGGMFYTRDGGSRFSREQLLEQLWENPARFSNNVLTRPLMQEILFPTLAFVAGPGEISYWGLLRSAFRQAGLEMPILFPRTGITLVSRKAEKEMRRFRLTVDDVLHRLQEKKQRWLERQVHLDVEEIFSQAQTRMDAIYRPLIREISSIRPDLESLGETNREKILEQVEYLKKETWKALKKREETDLRRFSELEAELLPKGLLQERVHNFIPWWNHFGEGWLEELVRSPLLSVHTHRVVYL